MPDVPSFENHDGSGASALSTSGRGRGSSQKALPWPTLPKAKSQSGLLAATSHTENYLYLARTGAPGTHSGSPVEPQSVFATLSLHSPSADFAKPPSPLPIQVEEVVTSPEKRQCKFKGISPAGEDSRKRPPGVRKPNSSLSNEKTQYQSTISKSSCAWPAASIKPQPVRPATGRERSRPRRGTQAKSVARTSEKFYPKSGDGRTIVPAPNPADQVRGPAGRIGIGIETEFLLRALQPEHRAENLHHFAAIVATNYNRRLAQQHPGMYENVSSLSAKKLVFDRWALTKDPTMTRNREPWGIEMATPLFVAFRGSNWRSHVDATWKYLRQNYRVIADEHCATHVHVSVEGGYSLAELKRIAGSVIQFEPAFDALVAPQRRSGQCEFAKSSWLDSDHLALQNRSRAQSVAYIDKISDFESLLLVMNPDDERKYGWNFLSIEKYYTVEFRKAQASTTGEEALSWAELAMSFIQAAIEHGSSAKLRQVPSTVGGLRWFLEQSHVPGLNEPERLQWLWTGKDVDEFVVGMPMRLALSREQEKLLEMRRKVDKGHIVMMTQTKQMPYWL